MMINWRRGKGDWNIGKTGYSISGAITTLDGLKNFDPAADAVANVTLCATVSVNTDMRGTDGANTTAPNTIAPDNAGITANGVAIAALNNFDPAVNVVARVTLCDTVTAVTGAWAIKKNAHAPSIPANWLTAAGIAAAAAVLYELGELGA